MTSSVLKYLTTKWSSQFLKTICRKMRILHLWRPQHWNAWPQNGLPNFWRRFVEGCICFICDVQHWNAWQQNGLPNFWRRFVEGCIFFICNVLSTEVLDCDVLSTEMLENKMVFLIFEDDLWKMHILHLWRPQHWNAHIINLTVIAFAIHATCTFQHRLFIVAGWATTYSIHASSHFTYTSYFGRAVVTGGLVVSQRWNVVT